MHAEMLLVLLGALFVSQIILILWKQKHPRSYNVSLGGVGGKALTMTMTPWNLPHGQWSKKLNMTMTPSILPMVNGQIDQF